MSAGRVSVLGSLEVSIDDRVIALGGPLQQRLLAALVVSTPRPTSADRLVDAVWGERPPRSARSTLQIYVSRLRKLLVGIGADITSATSMYTLHLPSGVLDVDAFRHRVAAARGHVASNRNDQAVHELSKALDLWRGSDALDGMQNEPWARPLTTPLAAERLDAQRLLGDALLAGGHPEAATAVLQTAAQAHPHDEGLVHQLMLALYRAGRHADALDAYESFRHRLADDLGLEPSRTLQDRQLAVLTHRADLAWTKHPHATPRLLPPRNRRFTGREEVMKEIQGLLEAGEVVTIFGLAGCGKSALALEIAHRHDGLVAWISADDRPSAVAALAGLAGAFDLSPDLDADALLAAIWGQLDKRDDWLLVFDNASAGEIVRGLLPPGRRGRVLITSQSPAWGAIGAARELVVLAETEAVDFVHSRLRQADSMEAALLARTLGNLPLALEQACAYIEQTGASIHDYLRMFHDNHRQLLQRGAPTGHESDVATTWRLLHERLAERSSRAAHLLEISAFLSADKQALKLLGAALNDDASELDLVDAVGELLRSSLLSRDEQSVRVHRLVQLVVRSGLPEPTRRRRLDAATKLVADAVPAEPSGPLNWPVWAELAPHVSALVRACDDAPPPPPLVTLALRCYRHLRSFGALASAGDLLEATIVALGSVSERTLELAELRAEHGDLLDARGLLADARAELLDVVGLLETIPDVDPRTLARVLVRLAHAENCADHSAQAVETYRRAIITMSDSTELEERVRARMGLGYALWSMNAYAAGEAEFRRAIEDCRLGGLTSHPLVGEALSGLGMMLHEQGKLEPARAAQDEALRMLLEIFGDEDRAIVAETRDKFGYVLGLLGHYRASLEQHTIAVAITQRLFGEHDSRLAITLTNLGLSESRVGQHTRARDHQRSALNILLSTHGIEHRDTRLVRSRLLEAEQTLETVGNQALHRPNNAHSAADAAET